MTDAPSPSEYEAAAEQIAAGDAKIKADIETVLAAFAVDCASHIASLEAAISTYAASVVLTPDQMRMKQLVENAKMNAQNLAQLSNQLSGPAHPMMPN